MFFWIYHFLCCTITWTTFNRFFLNFHKLLRVNGKRSVLVLCRRFKSYGTCFSESTIFYIVPFKNFPCIQMAIGLHSWLSCFVFFVVYKIDNESFLIAIFHPQDWKRMFCGLENWIFYIERIIRSFQYKKLGDMPLSFIFWSWKAAQGMQ